MTDPLYRTWDQTLAQRRVNYATLYKEAIPRARDQAFAADVELWWRLAQITNGLMFNLNPDSNKDAFVAKARKVKQFAQHALKFAPNHFEANLWASVATGTLIHQEEAVPTKIQLVPEAVQHLNECVRQQPTHWRVLYQEATLHWNLFHHPDPDLQRSVSAQVRAIQPNFAPLDQLTIERKLRRSLEVKPDFINLHYALFLVLLTQLKLREAVQVGERALGLERVCEMDRYLAANIEPFVEELRTTIKRSS